MRELCGHIPKYQQTSSLLAICTQFPLGPQPAAQIVTSNGQPGKKNHQLMVAFYLLSCTDKISYLITLRPAPMQSC